VGPDAATIQATGTDISGLWECTIAGFPSFAVPVRWVPAGPGIAQGQPYPEPYAVFYEPPGSTDCPGTSWCTFEWPNSTLQNFGDVAFTWEAMYTAPSTGTSSAAAPRAQRASTAWRQLKPCAPGTAEMPAQGLRLCGSS